MKVYAIVYNSFGCESKTVYTDIERTTGELVLAIYKCPLNNNMGTLINKDDICNIDIDIMIEDRYKGGLYITKSIEARNDIMSLVMRNVIDEAFVHVLDDMCCRHKVVPLFEA
jgi:hypothetical protein